MIDPNQPVKTPYDQKINRLQQKIHKKPGSNDRLRNKLTRLKVKQFGQTQSTPTALPWDAASQTAYNNATRDYNTTIAGITNQEAAANQEYGLGDNSNPFSRAAMLQQAYQRNQNSTLNTYAGRGQLYAGSTQNALGYDTSNFNQGVDALQRAYAAQSQSFDQARLQALTSEQDAQKAAAVTALQDALNTRPEGTPALPKYISRYYKQKIAHAKQQKHHGAKVHKLQRKLKNLKNPNPMNTTVGKTPNG